MQKHKTTGTGPEQQRAKESAAEIMRQKQAAGRRSISHDTPVPPYSLLDASRCEEGRSEEVNTRSQSMAGHLMKFLKSSGRWIVP